MKHNVEFKGFEQRDGAEERELRRLIEDEVARLDKRAKRFAQDELFLRVAVEHNSAHKIYHVSIAFDVPGKTLAAKEESRDARGVVKNALEELERQ